MEDARFVDIPELFRKKPTDVIFCPCCKRNNDENKAS